MWVYYRVCCVGMRLWIGVDGLKYWIIIYVFISSEVGWNIFGIIGCIGELG